MLTSNTYVTEKKKKCYGSRAKIDQLSDEIKVENSNNYRFHSRIVRDWAPKTVGSDRIHRQRRSGRVQASGGSESERKVLGISSIKACIHKHI